MNENIIGMICKTVFGSSCAIGGGIAISKLLDIWEVKSAERKKYWAEVEAANREKARIDAERKAEERRKFTAHVQMAVGDRDFETLIRNASINNKKLDLEDRLHAKELLEISYSKLMNTSTISSFDEQYGYFNALLNDIYTGDKDACTAGLNYWWGIHEFQLRINEENKRKREEEAERKRIAKKEEEERKRIEKQVMKEREQMYETINRGIQTIGNVANSAIVNK
jgi:hypothetical protein